MHSYDSTLCRFCPYHYGEQAAIVIRWVGKDPQLHEEFVGLYSVSQPDTGSIMTVITDVFFRLIIPLNNFLGQLIGPTVVGPRVLR